MDKLWYLSQVNMLNVLSMEDLKEIAQMTSMKKVENRSLILSPEKREEVLYILKKGMVRLYKLSSDGREFTLGILGDGNIFGEIETLSTGTSNMYAEAMGETLLCTLKKCDFEKLIESKPKLAYHFIQILTDRLREAQEMMENLATSNVEKRLVYLLHRLGASFGIKAEDGWTHIDVPLSHQDISNMIGSTRETVSATLNGLVKESVIKTGRKSIYINEEAIKQFIDSL